MFMITCEHINANELVSKAFRCAIEGLDGVVVKSISITDGTFTFCPYGSGSTVVSKFTVLLNQYYARFVADLEFSLIRTREFYNPEQINKKYYKYIWNLVVSNEVVEDGDV